MITSGVNFNLYKSFVVVYEQKNISRAAAQLEITQPTVTYNIKELERQLNVKLFHTHPRGVEPTKEAHELYKFVSEGMNSIANGENAIREFNEDSSHTLRVSAQGGISAVYLAKAMALMTKKYPNVKFEVLYASYGDPLARLAQHAADVVFTFADVENPSLIPIVLKDIPRVGIVSQNFALKHSIGNAVAPKDLEKIPFVMFEKNMKFITPKVKATPYAIVEDSRNLFAIVAADLGLGVCSEEEFDNSGTSGINKVDVSSLDLPKRSLKCVYNKESFNKPTRAFIEVVCEVFGLKNPV